MRLHDLDPPTTSHRRLATDGVGQLVLVGLEVLERLLELDALGIARRVREDGFVYGVGNSRTGIREPSMALHRRLLHRPDSLSPRPAWRSCHIRGSCSGSERRWLIAARW